MDTVDEKAVEYLVATFDTREHRDTFASIAGDMQGVVITISVTDPSASQGDYTASAVLPDHLRSGDCQAALLVQGIASIAAAHGATRVVRCGVRCGEQLLL